MNFLEEYSYSAVLSRLLSRVDDKYDKRESSVIYNTLAPAALEFANAYVDLQQVENEGFADTAGYYFLKRRAAERGLTPEEATPAVLKGRFDKEIELGKRFTGLNTTLNYTVSEFIKSAAEGGVTYYYYRCICEDTGEAGNEYIGGLLPLDGDIEGLGVAELTEILIHGENAEDIETFRQRYFDDINNQAFGGNTAQYKEMVEDLPDVGGCKVYPVWNGGGTVKIVFTNAEHESPSEPLVASVQEQIDPVDKQGQGVGMAPIGHKVTVEGAETEYLTIQTNITYETGYEWNDVSNAFNEVIDTYLAELNADWKNNEKTVVRISQIESRLLDITGILDVDGTTINGAAGNYSADENAVVKRAVS